MFDSMGSSIINVFYNSTTGVSDYCCGTPIASSDGQGTQCQYNQPSFTLPQASILPGYAALKGYTNTASSSGSSNTTSPVPSSSTSTSTSNSHDVALGAGLGVPLGVIALGSLIWGYYERRRANQFRKAMTENSVPTQSLLGTKTPHSHYTGSSAPTELDSQQRFAELQGSH